MRFLLFGLLEASRKERRETVQGSEDWHLRALERYQSPERSDYADNYESNDRGDALDNLLLGLDTLGKFLKTVYRFQKRSCIAWNFKKNIKMKAIMKNFKV